MRFEARDFNPDRTGIGGSDIVRIEIIHETEYTEMMRANETLEQFTARLQVMQEKLGAFHEAVEKLDRELSSPKPDAIKVDMLLNQARKTNGELREFAAKLVSEFHAYDLEKPFAGHVEQMGEQLQAQAIYRTASGATVRCGCD